MVMTDPLGDLFTRIRNGQRARKGSIVAPASKLGASVLDVLQREGFIRSHSTAEVRPGVAQMTVQLKYAEGEPAIQEIARVSKPGRRVYCGCDELPRYYNGLGVGIVSTPRGVMTDSDAREARLGGELLGRIF